MGELDVHRARIDRSPGLSGRPAHAWRRRHYWPTYVYGAPQYDYYPNYVYSEPTYVAPTYVAPIVTPGLGFGWRGGWGHRHIGGFRRW